MTDTVAPLPPMPEPVGFFARFYTATLLFLIAAMLAGGGSQLRLPGLFIGAGLCALVALGLIVGQVWAKYLCYAIFAALCLGVVGALAYVLVQSVRGGSHEGLGLALMFGMVCLAAFSYAMFITRVIYAEQALRRARRIALDGSARRG